MADNPSPTADDEKRALSTAYTQFYAGPFQQLTLQTKSNVTAPEIAADAATARQGTDAVSEQEMQTLTGRRTELYRSDPLGPMPPDYTGTFIPLLLAANKSAMLGPVKPEAAALLNQQIGLVAGATGLDPQQVANMAGRYQMAMSATAYQLGDSFGVTPATPATSTSRELGALMMKAMLEGPLSPAEYAAAEKDVTQFRKDRHLSEKDVNRMESSFLIGAIGTIAAVETAHAAQFNDEAQQMHAGRGMAFVGDSADENRVAVPKFTGPGPRPQFGAWMINPDDPPPKAPPGTKEYADFLVSLHESEHLSRRVDAIAPMSLSVDARKQAAEIDADKAIMTFLDGEGDKAAKNYYLQARQVDSFSYGVLTNDLTHDTATFLRVQEATGRQIDLDKFDTAKRDLLARVREKGSFAAMGAFNRGRVPDVMGAVQDVLTGDKAQTDPAKKLSAMQVEEAQSFLKDAQALGYAANPNYPKAPPPVQPVAQTPVADAGTTAIPASTTPAGPKV